MRDAGPCTDSRVVAEVTSVTTATSPGSALTINNNLSPNTYYGLASDTNKGTANHLTASHTHRFDGDSELRTAPPC